MAPSERVYGLQELYRPNDREPDVDIVAVHGLGGEAINTWTSKKDKICWLNHPDFLPKYVKNARVLVWGYNSSFTSLTGTEPSKDRIHHHAQTLVMNLATDRRLEGMENKPIIFLCHSLGGIVVKRALSYATQLNEARVTHLRRIATCTYGILFFGTPHNGASKARLLSTLQKLGSLALPTKAVDMERGLVAALEEESETLQNITDYFVRIMNEYCLFFFWEQQKSSLKYTRDYIVAESSAAPTYRDTERCGIPADHVNMVKFNDNRSSSFRVVVDALMRYAEQAPDVIRRRCAAVESQSMEQRRREAMEILLHQQVRGGDIAWIPGIRPGTVREIEEGDRVSARFQRSATSSDQLYSLRG